jgi:hypothetical protein
MFTEHKMKIIERTHNLETGEVLDTERDMTKTELDAYNSAKAEADAKAEAEADAATEKAALLAQLGITEDQAKLLLS